MKTNSLHPFKLLCTAVRCLFFLVLLNCVDAHASTTELSYPDLNTWLKGRPILFIGGFYGREVLQHYFQYMKDFESEANRLGMKAQVIYPSSLLGDEETMDLIYGAIRTLHSTADLESEGKRKGVIVLGHSKGASRLWVTLLNHPEILDLLEDGISLQGCFGGSFIMGHVLPWSLKPLEFSAMSSVLGARGIHALKTAPDGANSVHKILAELILKKHDPRTSQGETFLKKLHQKLHYIKTEIPEDEMSWFSWGAQRFSFRSSSEPNDGMISVEHQQVNGDALFQLLTDRISPDSYLKDRDSISRSVYLSLGTPLIQNNLKADHIELTTNLMDWTRSVSRRTDYSAEGRRYFLNETLENLHRKKFIQGEARKPIFVIQ